MRDRIIGSRCEGTQETLTHDDIGLLCGGDVVPNGRIISIAVPAAQWVAA